MNYSKCHASIIFTNFFIFYFLESEEYRFELTRRGRPKMLFRGHSFVQDSRQSNKGNYILWRCVRESNSKCKARLTLFKNGQIFIKGFHNH